MGTLSGDGSTCTGEVLGRAPLQIAAYEGEQREPAVAAFGGRFLVTWKEERNDPQGDIYATLIDGGGGILFPEGFAVCAATTEFDYTDVAAAQEEPRVTATADGFFVVWEDGRHAYLEERQVFGARVSASGHVERDQQVASGTSEGTDLQAATFVGDHPVIVWKTESDVFASMISGRTASTFHLASGPTQYGLEECDAAGGGGELLVACSELTRVDGVDAGYLVRAYRHSVSASAPPAHVESRTISSFFDTHLAPSVAFDGKHFRVAWAEHRVGEATSTDVHQAVVGWEGEATAIEGARSPRLAYGIGEILVALRGDRVVAVFGQPQDRGPDPAPEGSSGGAGCSVVASNDGSRSGLLGVHFVAGLAVFAIRLLTPASLRRVFGRQPTSDDAARALNRRVEPTRG